MIKLTMTVGTQARVPQYITRTLVSSVLRYTLFACAASVTMSVTACGIDREGVAPSIDPSALLRSVQMEYDAYNLSRVKPYDTVSLKARGISGTGSVIDAPVVFAFDSRYVTVNSDGLLQAVASTARTVVTATMSYGGSTRVDTTIVSVVNGAPRHLARVAIAPNPGDSAKVATQSPGPRTFKSLQLIRMDSSNTTVSDVLVSLSSSDLAVAKIVQAGNYVTVTPFRPGRVVFYVSTYAYGTGFRDSLSFTVGWPLTINLGVYTRIPTGTTTPVLALTTGRITAAVGACVVWQNANEVLDLDIVFDDTTRALPPDSATVAARAWCIQWGAIDTASDGTRNGGNIAAFHMHRTPNGDPDVFSSQRARSFTQPGVYTYRNTRFGLVGTIVVCDERNDSSCAPENFQWRASKQ